MIDALLKAELVTQVEHQRKLAAEKSKIARNINVVAGSVKVTLDGVSHCGSVSEFRDTARKLILTDPASVNLIVRKAHRFKGVPGGRELIYALYQIREKAPSMSDNDRTKFINRALRGAGRTLATPQ
jgi:hypothetical protein